MSRDTSAELSRYSVTETLRDGRRIEIRALKPTDQEELLSAVGRLSDESVYRRFFSPKRHFTDDEISFYTKVDFVKHAALVAVLREDGRPAIVGGARYVVSKPRAAEIAFAVNDAYQGQGIGALLMKHLAAIAGQCKLEQLFAEVLASNTAMLKVFEKSGFCVESKRDGAVVHVTLQVA